jgi:hypothetical protein
VRGPAREGHAQGEHKDLDFIVGSSRLNANVDPYFGEPLPRADRRGGEEGRVGRQGIVYGKVYGEQLFSAKELTVYPARR